MIFLFLIDNRFSRVCSPARRGSVRRTGGATDSQAEVAESASFAVANRLVFAGTSFVGEQKRAPDDSNTATFAGTRLTNEAVYFNAFAY